MKHIIDEVEFFSGYTPKVSKKEKIYSFAQATGLVLFWGSTFYLFTYAYLFITAK